jgi:hypothetical protein
MGSKKVAGGLAKFHGLLIEKRENTNRYQCEHDLTDAELVAIIRGDSVPAAVPAGGLAH